MQIFHKLIKILDIYENKSKKKESFTQTSLFLNLDEKEEEPSISKVEERLNEINPLEITPIEALNILYELKQELKNKE